MIQRILSRLKNFAKRLSANDLRTSLSKREIFLPVSSRRWGFAQKAESESWHIPHNLIEPEISAYFLEEQTKAKFLVHVAEQTLGLSFSNFISERTVLDIACGPGSIIAEMDKPAVKYGLDPAKFPNWVHGRYKELNFQLINHPLESAPLADFDFGVNPLVIMYNALQHFQDCELAFSNLAKSLGTHQVFFVDYGYVPADAAHPQILTFNRIERILSRVGYETTNLALSYARLPGLVEMGNGEPARILAGIAEYKL
jgi:hypothetical protein